MTTSSTNRRPSAAAAPASAAMRCIALIAAATLAGAFGPGAHAGGTPGPLPRLSLDPAGTTVAGLSSGGYMATQFQVAHARLVRGAGIFAAGPWWCARGSLGRALGECLDEPHSRPGAPDLIAHALAEGAAGRNDDPKQLADDRVWTFRGTRDDRIAQPVADGLVEFYRAFVPGANFVHIANVPAAHGVPTPATGAACGTTAEPYLNACGYDGPGAMLAHLYGPLAPPAPPRALQRFDQRPYDPRTSLAREGYLYVPAACAQGERCRLHVVFHGCRQGAEFVGEVFVREAGWNGWAEANRIVVLYPQTRRSLMRPSNPQGCWDWWGYTGANYATRAGTQVAAVRAMVTALGGF